MGNSATIPLNSLKVTQLVSPQMKTKQFVLTPKLCVAIFQSKSLNGTEAEVDKLKNFIERQSNIRIINAQEAKICDRELVKFIGCEIKNKPLSFEAGNHLKSVMNHLNSSYAKPSLVSQIILPELELIAGKNLSIHRQNRLWYWLSIARRIFYYIYSKFRFELTPKSLRRAPAIHAIHGLDRAHKFSLKLAVEMWKIIYGHPYVKAKDKEFLSNALNIEDNLYHTCQYTNRTLHVKSDNEIISALKQNSNVTKLTPEAKARVKQVLGAISKLEKHSDSDLIKDFCTKSTKLLRQI